MTWSWIQTAPWACAGIGAVGHGGHRQARHRYRWLDTPKRDGQPDCTQRTHDRYHQRRSRSSHLAEAGAAVRPQRPVLLFIQELHRESSVRRKVADVSRQCSSNSPTPTYRRSSRCRRRVADQRSRGSLPGVLAHCEAVVDRLPVSPVAGYLRSLAIKPKRTRPYRPQTNGKIERFHRTMADGWAYARCYRSEHERREALAAWLHHYNHHRSHTACANQPPFTRLSTSPVSTPRAPWSGLDGACIVGRWLLAP
jgi:Integrase core domain